MRQHLIAVSVAALLAATGCDRGPDLPGDQAAEGVEPKQVSAEALRAAVKDPRVRQFYEAREWKAAWNEDQARELAEALRAAPRHGLEAAKFLRDGDAAKDPVEREATLSAAAIGYADALANGQVDPGRLFEPYTLARPRVNVAAGLNEAIGASNVGEWLSNLAPQDGEYRALSEAFLRYAQAAGQPAPQIEAGEAIKPGDRDARIPQVVQALRMNGYLSGEQPDGRAPEGQANVYSEAIAAAVKRMQQDYGEKPDGVIGKGTLALLNTGPAERARQLALNLERRRWLSREVPKTRIDVNTAAALLSYFRDG